MKQLLFLLLFPCLCVAQYTGNAGQKITLGEQTTADGLVFRGAAADTVTATLKITKTNKQDTSAFLLLDTLNNVLLKYNIATTYWTRLNLLPSDTTSMLLPYWRSGRFSGTLPVANGGTGQTTPTEALNALLPTQSQSSTIGATLKSNGTNSYWDNFSAAGTVQDQSGNFYNTVAIGTQVWFKENLRTKKYRSGALIPVKTNTDTSTIVGQMYYYNNDSLTYYPVYGALYNWKATQSSDSLCPVGWDVPTDAEWTTLTNFLSSNQGGKLKGTGTTYWNSPNTGATNEVGFSALPGGLRYLDGSFYNINNYAFFWSATQYDNFDALFRQLETNNGDVSRANLSKSVGASIRCLKN